MQGKSKEGKNTSISAKPQSSTDHKKKKKNDEQKQMTAITNNLIAFLMH
jgi:hypothetical protein